MAADNAASVIGGGSVFLRTGHGRCNRPDAAVILAESQRLSVSMVMVLMTAMAGAIVTKASMRCLISSPGLASRWPMNRSMAARIVSVMVAASVANVSSVAMVIRMAK